MGNLTDKSVKNAQPSSKDTFLSDGDGLALRIIKSGAKSWVFRYRRPIDKKQNKFVFGSYPEMSLKDARKKIVTFHEDLTKGIDPKLARAAEYAENANALTTGKVFDDWLAHITTAGDITERAIKQHKDRWERHLKKRLSNILVRDVTRAHIASTLDAMRKKGIREETRKALTTINLFMDYAVSRHYAEANPARLLKPKDFGSSANRPKERALSLAELRGVWAALDEAVKEKPGIASTARLSPLAANIIKLLIITGARRAEVVGMRWDELDLEKGEWCLPSHRTKNRRSHTIYLPPIAVMLIESMKEISGGSVFVFESLRKPGQPLSLDSLTTAIQRLRGMYRKENEDRALLEHLAPFTAHDLRRSAATAWGEHLKVLPHVIECMLNHQPENKLIATYQRATYQAEQKQAWLMWGRKVEAVVAHDPGNVVLINSYN